MAKRDATFHDEADQADRQTKRRKYAASHSHAQNEPATIEEIYSARQLQGLLRFQQDLDLRSGVQSFKAFLDSILYPEDPDGVGTKRAILEEFLSSQKPRSGDLQHAFLEDVIQTWSFASQDNNDNLVGSVTALLALLLKLLSSHLEFRQHGINLSRTLLRLPQLRLIRRSLGAPRHKPFVISPILRLLTELVSFDGGVLARELYSHREYTFEPQIIAHHISGKGELQSHDSAKPSVRSNAIRYLLANIKYQNEGVKIDIIKQANINRALFAHVDQDAPGLVNEILDVLRTHVIFDEEIPRHNKTFFLDDRNLASILSVSRRSDSQPESDTGAEAVPVQHTALKFLRLVCTTPNLGVFIPCRGWSGRSGEEDEDSLAPVTDSAEGGQDIEDATSAVVVRNTTLASFIHVLRPFANEQEMDLLVDIFRAAPELVADYFAKKTAFPFDPSLTATWIGYAAFLFSVVNLPIPSLQDLRTPPPASVVVDSLLPRPLNEKTLTRCINHSSDLVRIFAAWILAVAIRKLGSVAASWRERGETSWSSAATRLELRFGRRCPSVANVVNLMRQSSKKQMQYEASARLLRLYYEVLPWLAFKDKLDVSASITLELQALKTPDAQDEGARRMKLLTLSHLLAVAQLASGMQWWKKPEGLLYSPFTTLLGLAAGDQQFRAQNDALLTALADETGSNSRSLAALLTSLAQAGDSSPPVLTFVDECFLRLVRAPIKYADLLDAAAVEAGAAGERSGNAPLFLMTIEEQLPFAERSDHAKEIVAWAFSFLAQLHDSGDTMLTFIRDRMVDTLKNEKLRVLARDTFAKSIKVNNASGLPQDAVVVHDGGHAAAPDNEEYHKSFEQHSPPQESTKLGVLQRWLQDDISEILEARLAGPLLLLCSTNDSIRRQAALSLSKFIARLSPTDTDQLQHFLLLSQLQETLQVLQHFSQTDALRVPCLLVTFVIHAAAVLNDPTHILYAKLNAYMNENPSWRLSKLPSYWMRAIIDCPPDDDNVNSAWQEVEWLLDWIYDGLRTSEDMDLLRKCGAFEKVWGLYDVAHASVRAKILQLTMRAVEVQGGSTTLVTRFGGLEWCREKAASKNQLRDKKLLLAIRRRMWQTCDQERVARWSHGEVPRDMNHKADA